MISFIEASFFLVSMFAQAGVPADRVYYKKRAGLPRSDFISLIQWHMEILAMRPGFGRTQNCSINKQKFGNGYFLINCCGIASLDKRPLPARPCLDAS